MIQRLVVCCTTAALLAGCGGQIKVEPAPDLSGPFVMVRKDSLSSSAPAVGRNTNDAKDSFFIAIKKSELKKPYFLSAFLTELFPRTAPGLQTLGTRVVSFEVQNDKLFVFDVDRRKKTSDVADPTVVVEAYPLIRGWTQFFALPNAQDYVLFDPAAGLNRFDLVGDAFSSPNGLGRFQIDLAYSQNYKAVKDGVSFEQAFAGHGELPNTANDGTLEYNTYRYSGTVRMTLRKYSEGAGFKIAPAQQRPFFFTSDVRLVPNQTRSEDSPVRWNIQPDTKIVYKVGRTVNDLQQDPRFANIRIYKALADGVENWNSVFGRKVFESQLADVNDSPGDDDVNFVTVDPDQTFGFARANWRSNPNTGEIRGASVYFNSIWLDIGDLTFTDDPAAFSRKAETLRQKMGAAERGPNLAWSGMKPVDGCNKDARQMVDELLERGPASQTLMAGSTKAEKIERFLTHVMIHEVGHTIGLRHNFKGSLVAPSSSVMEYIVNEDSIFADTPQAYDIEAVKFLYGISPDAPKLPFCTDEDTQTDPGCTQFDRTASPLEQWDGANYTTVANTYVTGGNGFPNTTLNNLAKWVRSPVSTPAEKQQAWNLLLAPINAAPAGAQPTRVDVLARAIINRLYFDLPAARGTFASDPIVTETVQTYITDQVRGDLINASSNRSFATRRVAVDALKKQQTLRAYQALLDAKTAITTVRATLTGTDAALTDDLLGRLAVAINPYFVK